MLHVAFAGTFAESLEQPVRRYLTTGCDVVVTDETGIVPLLDGIDVLVTMTLTAETGRAAKRLKLVQVPGAGLDRIDRAALPREAMLANAYGHETGIAEYVISAVLALTREFGRLDSALRRGDWQSQWAVGAAPPPVWPELAGKTIGILGYGRIGRSIARRARAFAMPVCAIRRDLGQSAGDELALLGGPGLTDEVLRRSDYVVIAMPATPETIGRIGHRELALMKPSAFLINVARAEIVDEDALYDALSRRSIAGAALDVWYRYPREPGHAAPANRSFHELPNLLMTPHIEDWTDGMLQARARLIAENIKRVARNEAPLNLIC
ncbi:MAG: phosphoglycerate dehydrogenase [Alphaproteobacteria bacterium]|nr:phosphoglycerate dehydrogenase [Alphaproteobacteria bacterium]